MDNILTIVFFNSLIGGAMGVVAALISNGNKAMAFAVCLLFGPVGLLVVLGVEYSHSVSLPKAEPIKKCRKCKRQVSTNALVCPNCQTPIAH